ncbi:uncharacterized protein BDV17DRAFT_254693 [Aspergillus undulatus]|uniref:uncharacterized protein n=1 Tax=Aspergillus undulatus TaxID=1810928 RepID=UPI003CCD359A
MRISVSERKWDKCWLAGCDEVLDFHWSVLHLAGLKAHKTMRRGGSVYRLWYNQ